MFNVQQSIVFKDPTPQVPIPETPSPLKPILPNDEPPHTPELIKLM